MSHIARINYYAHTLTEAQEEMGILSRLGWDVTLNGNESEGYVVLAQKVRE